MATFIIRVKIDTGTVVDEQKLEKAMGAENFIRTAETSDPAENVFAYYGNQGMLEINNAVKRAGKFAGKSVSFTVIKDKLAEKQHHKAAIHQISNKRSDNL